MHESQDITQEMEKVTFSINFYTPPIPCRLINRDKGGREGLLELEKACSKAQAEETSWPVCGSLLLLKRKGKRQKVTTEVPNQGLCVC